MCGIAGVVWAHPEAEVAEVQLRRMAAALRHRGPDGFGIARDRGAGFASTRLAIFDPPEGWQPMRAGASRPLIVYNGEVYNHYELRRELRAAGLSFATGTDTEVVMRLLERDGRAALDRFNGQFAIAWWEPEHRRLTLIRDRFGVRPLHWAEMPGGGLTFASEAKALFASGEVAPEPDFDGLDDVFTLWGARSPRTVFRSVQQVPPGGLVVWERGRIVEQRIWWRPEYGEASGEPEELEDLLRDSVRLRLRADVPVGTYLSGGLDSSVVTALAQHASDHELRTFSVAFDDQRYDERVFQETVAARLGTQHHVIEIGRREVADAFRTTIWHCESPLVRTAPVPLMLLARSAREQGITVVATGEGADELYWGYDLFKETALRDLHSRDPQLALRLLEQLYPYLDGSAARRGPAWSRFFFGAGDGDDPLFSHQTRISATGVVKAFFRPEISAELRAREPLERLRAELPEAFGRWSRLERAAYLEITTLLSPYLLSAQGDRVAMAHGVEGRYPFLDHRVFAHAAALPPHRKLDGMREKAELKDLAARLLPPEIAERTKQPYRAPEVAPFFGPQAPEWVEELLSSEAIETAGIFDGARVQSLLARCRAGRAKGIREGMALVGVLSTQVWYERFCRSGASPPEERGEPRVTLDLTADTQPERTV